MGKTVGHSVRSGNFGGCSPLDAKGEASQIDLPSMDLSAAMERVWHGHNTREKTERAYLAHRKVEDQYLEFWRLCKEHPEISHPVPNAAVHTLWLAHIADTQRYAADCDRYFGYFLHHEPDEVDPNPGTASS